MKTKIACLLAIIGFLMLIDVTGASAQDTSRFNRRNFNQPDVLGLTSQQQEKIQEIRMSFAREILDLRNKIDEKEASLRTLVQQEKSDEKRANQVLEEIYVLKHELAQNRLKARLEIRNQLTEEQKLIFDMKSQKRSDIAARPFLRNRMYWQKKPNNIDNRGQMRRGMGRPMPRSN